MAEALPRTRAEARKAGAAFGEEVASIMADAILSCPDGDRTEEFTDGLIAQAHVEMEAAAALYSAAGVPFLIVMRFRTAYLRALRNRTGLMQIAATAAGTPN